MIVEGECAPDFSGEGPDGRSVRLADYRGKKHVVLYFFARDFTPG